MRTLIWIASTLLFGVAACGDDSSSDAGGADGSSSSPTMSTSSTSSTSSTDGSTSVEAGSGDGSASGDPQASSSGGSSGGQGDCEPDGDLLYPLAEGRVWTFEVISSGCNEPVYPVTVGAIEMVGGREAFLVTTGTVECGVVERHLSQNGQAVDRYDPLNDTWTPLVAEPIEDGAVWADGEQRWEAVAEITVPAGTFADCWRAVDPQDGVTGTTFCPGVGPVQLRGFELTQNLVGCG